MIILKKLTSLRIEWYIFQPLRSFTNRFLFAYSLLKTLYFCCNICMLIFSFAIRIFTEKNEVGHISIVVY